MIRRKRIYRERGGKEGGGDVEIKDRPKIKRREKENKFMQGGRKEKDETGK